MRDAIGISAGVVDIHVVGNVLQIEVPDVADPLVQDEDGRLVVAASGSTMTDDDVRELRLGLQQR
ncbi:AbrB/MazE/SpoVT family DNA-binding domain-containing protein [Microbacterium elymi]|uniref:AbrB/MazE/SpoVT family DNA-binding domain-containing protein n=1 Tax=Microbacterium elymi TaxID=2909587 RepID=A0ABY5NH16_9MICO|nr:AbrB/MazE/SpoVT family DNA-binding domain-containing protein [Microbacterium elymi]UUT34477.1 AbrB/MazE/SpoVT family DNA-binding domain-containing protein [Microbacterium elymi]